MDFSLLIIIAGIITILSLLFTFLGGLKVIKMKFKTHRNFAIVTLILASIHGTIALLYFTGIISF